MIASMTGFGRGEITKNGTTANIEIRCVNSRFLEITTRMPRALSQREKEIKDLVRTYVNRGGLTITITVDEEDDGQAALSVNSSAAKSYLKLLNELRKVTKIKEKVRLEHLLKFSEVFEVPNGEETDERLWNVVVDALHVALKDFTTMRQNEGSELAKDLEKRILWMEEIVNQIEALSKLRIPEELKKLEERIALLVADKNIIDQNRLELEVALLADKLDVTEECVRFRSHNKFFLEAMAGEESAGRKLNFLVQEINREANTIGSKTNDATIAHLVVRMKEELEKVREQLQNIE
ncbi:MAG: YicC family protein [Ignavibacteriales bacterium]|nr:YicC family protein [Ignavibacteriales bacterium]